MNREIKFRGKDEHGCWRFGWLEVTNDGRFYILENDKYWFDDGFHNADFSGSYEVHENTIGQFTGLFDRNCKEIYEGDIVKHPYIDPIFRDLVESKDGDGVTSEVVFHDGAFCVKYDVDDFIYLDSFTRYDHIEVIGNEFDNPDLIKSL